MKNLVLMLGMILFFFCSCDSLKRIENNKSIIENKEEIFENQGVSDSTVGQPVIDINQNIDASNNNRIEANIELIGKDVYIHNQVLEFEISGFETKVFEAPLSDTVIYVVQKGDKIVVTSVIDYLSEKKTYIQVTLPNNKVGYISLYSNPYKNKSFSYLESIEINGNEIRILKMEKKFLISDETIVKDLPSVNAENLHTITHDEGRIYYNSLKITENYEWVYVIVNEHKGWVPADALGVDRGGPTLDTPEESIYWDLIGGNLI